MKKSIVALSAICSFALAQGSSLVPYFSYIDYDKATRDNASIVGLYASHGDTQYKIETDIEYFTLDYNDNTPTYRQWDWTIVGNYYYGSNVVLRAGIHNIFIDQTNNNNDYDKVLFAGATYYVLNQYSMGIDYYFSDYDNFEVHQFTPKATYTLNSLSQEYGVITLEGKVNFIKISNSGYTTKDNYTNADFDFYDTKGPWTTHIGFNIGKNSYKVAKDGYVVYNLGAEYKYGMGIDLTYAISHTDFLKIGYNRSKFDEGSDKGAYSNLFLLSYSKSF
ncbi:hypothetical protein [Nitratiruptor sp. SB155-2]|uniref:hypothetical protein n=1 Tax=Nitratiruptor sp. (strain SB155-2) TaxID=387092 RepID=UPI0001586F7F|nr:hypothetical protein [Nitratiruptor sp. SB155-2]BAF69608.1 hypothetical protein NIS_0494 [Nitratiruptor sp. SB155-2]